MYVHISIRSAPCLRIRNICHFFDTWLEKLYYTYTIANRIESNRMEWNRIATHLLGLVWIRMDWIRWMGLYFGYSCANDFSLISGLRTWDAGRRSQDAGRPKIGRSVEIEGLQGRITSLRDGNYVCERDYSLRSTMVIVYREITEHFYSWEQLRAKTIGARLGWERLLGSEKQAILSHPTRQPLFSGFPMFLVSVCSQFINL